MDAFNSKSYTVKEKRSRVSTGITQFDELLSGGLPHCSITLVSGTPGSGKTILCFNYIDAGLKNGEKCLYLASDERIENIICQSAELGFDFKDAMSRGQLKFLYLDLDRSDVHNEIEQEIRVGGYSRVVLDSLTPVSELPVWVMSGGRELIPSMDKENGPRSLPVDSLPATRSHIRRMMGILSTNGCTAMVTSEIPEGSRCLSRDSVSEFLADGIILMDLDSTMDRRKLTIRKMRATHHTLKPQNIQIACGGIKFV